MFLLKGILIGLIFGIPAGAVGALCIQRTLLYGRKAGLITGLGSSAADCFYAAVGAFGITFISDFLTKYQTIINLAGGLLILVMGISIPLKKQISSTETENKMGYSTMFLSSLGVGITNPAAVITFLFAFSYFGIDGKQGILNGASLVSGVLLGTLAWWAALSGIAGMIKNKHGEKGFERLNKLFGVIMIGFGVIIFLRMILER